MSVLSIEKLTDNEEDRHRLITLFFALDFDYVPPLTSVVDVPEYAGKLLENAEVLVAVFNKVDVGLIAMYANDSREHAAFISTIGVLSSARGQGLGIRLLDEAAVLCIKNGMKSLRLEVSAQNKPAVKLYERCGFRLFSGVTEDGSYEHSLLFEKIL